MWNSSSTYVRQEQSVIRAAHRRCVRESLDLPAVTTAVVLEVLLLHPWHGEASCMFREAILTRGE